VRKKGVVYLVRVGVRGRVRVGVRG